MDKYAVIVAGGSGSRMLSSVPKQFIEVCGKPVLYYSISTFTSTFPGIQIILVIPADHMSVAAELVRRYFADEKIELLPGGASRFESVKNGLGRITTESIVFVHDGVRCLVTGELLQNCYNLAQKTGSAIPVIRPKDSLRIVSDKGSRVIDRDTVRIIQTPQVFKSGILLPAFDVPYLESFTDEASVVEAHGSVVSLLEGEERNIKITTPVDLLIAASIIGLDRQNEK